MSYLKEYRPEDDEERQDELSRNDGGMDTGLVARTSVGGDGVQGPIKPPVGSALPGGNSPSGGRFVNFANRLSANQGVVDRTVNEVAGRVERKAADAQAGLGDLTRQFGQDSRAGMGWAPGRASFETMRTTANTQNTGSQEAVQPTGLQNLLAATSPAAVTPEAATYHGPTDLSQVAGYQNALNNITSARDEVDKLGTPSKRQALLQRTYGAADANDAAMFGAAGGSRFRGLLSKYGKMDSAPALAQSQAAGAALTAQGQQASEWAQKKAAAAEPPTLVDGTAQPEAAPNPHNPGNKPLSFNEFMNVRDDGTTDPAKWDDADPDWNLKARLYIARSLDIEGIYASLTPADIEMLRGMTDDEIDRFLVLRDKQIKPGGPLDPVNRGTGTSSEYKPSAATKRRVEAVGAGKSRNGN